MKYDSRTLLGTLVLVLFSGGIVLLTRDKRNLVDPEELCRQAVDSFGRITPEGRQHYYERCCDYPKEGMFQLLVWDLVDADARDEETLEETIRRGREEWTDLGQRLHILQLMNNREVTERVEVQTGGTALWTVNGAGSITISSEDGSHPTHSATMVVPEELDEVRWPSADQSNIPDDFCLWCHVLSLIGEFLFISIAIIKQVFKDLIFSYWHTMDWFLGNMVNFFS